jgi:glucosylceramidase
VSLARAASSRVTLAFDAARLAVTPADGSDRAVVRGQYRLAVGDLSTTFTITHGAETLDRTGWTASASSVPTDPCCTGDVPANAIDGQAATRWTTGAAEQPGQWLTIDLGTPQAFNSLVLDAGASSGDYPRRHEIYSTNNPNAWGDPIASGAGAAVRSATFALTIARYVRIRQTGTAGSWWRVHELNLYR